MAVLHYIQQSSKTDMEMNSAEIKGWLSIHSSLMNEDNRNIQDFIDEHKEKLGHIKWFDKPQVVFQILAECVGDANLRKALQTWFGQFDGAQICECCGKVMWSGYSWAGHAYCSIDCILDAESTTLTEIDRELHNDDEIGSECYYTEWK